jgi:two-component system cell cycle sensor histidine kinase/response regulator CckA
MNTKPERDESATTALAQRHRWGAWGLLAAGLVVTGLAALYGKAMVEAAAHREFDFTCNEIRLNVAARVAACAQILHSGAALFAVAETVEREDWRAFVQGLQVEQLLPGIQGVGFAQWLSREQLTEHIQALQREGFPDYQVTPGGEREAYSAIIYLEPFAARNRRAFGYDMYSEPVRRAAMEQARDENRAALSGKVILVQETDKEVQAGTLMYVPVYRHGLPHETRDQRRAALQGWVYSPYRMTDLMHGTLRDWEVKHKGRQIYLQIYDGAVPSAKTLLYDSQGAGKPPPAAVAGATRLIPLDFAGHRWTLRFSQFGGLATAADYGTVWLVLCAGTSISLLLFGLIFALLGTRATAQRMAQQLTAELRESEEKYRVVFNNEIYAICIFDLETRQFVDVNEAFVRLYGYGRDELLSGLTIHAISAEHQVSDAATAQAVREGTTFIPLRYHRKKDGTVFPVEIVGRPYVWQGRNVMFALVHDITERKQADEELRLFKAIIDASEEAIAISDAGGKLIYINPAHERLFGRTLEQARRANYRDYYPPESVALLEQVVVPALKRGENAVSELDAFDAAGRRFPLWERAGALTNADGTLRFGFGLMHDISERKRMEASLRQSEERLREVLENSLDASYKRNLQTNSYDYLSPVFAQISGYPPDEMKAMSVETVLALIHPDDQAEVARVIALSLSSATGTAHRLKYRFRNKAGQYRWLQDHFVFIRDADGQPLARIGSVGDITAHKQDEAANAALEAQNRQLQKSESLGRMAGAIAHHFNNQLQGVMGNLELAMADLPPGAEPVANLTEAMQAARKAAEMSHLMLTYLGQTRGQQEPLDLADICRLNLPLFRVGLPPNVVLTVDLPAPGPFIRANANQLQQVLTNLLTNAREASGTGPGEIRLSVTTVAAAAIPAVNRFPLDGQLQDTTYACLEVADAGGGIPAPDIEKIFDPFFSRKFTGRGLGLPVVLGIVREHRGVITVTSTPDRGSVFRVFLPVLAATAPRPPAPVVVQTLPKAGAGSAADAAPTRTILVVDDDPGVLWVATRALKHAGFTVLAAAGGAEAVALFRQHRTEIDGVLCDLSMPRMDGWETLTALRQLAPGLPVILSSGYDAAQVLAGDHPDLPQAFLGKPYQLATLRDTISQVLLNAKNK